MSKFQSEGEVMLAPRLYILHAPGSIFEISRFLDTHARKDWSTGLIKLVEIGPHSFSAKNQLPTYRSRHKMRDAAITREVIDDFVNQRSMFAILHKTDRWLQDALTSDEKEILETFSCARIHGNGSGMYHDLNLLLKLLDLDWRKAVLDSLGGTNLSIDRQRIEKWKQQFDVIDCGQEAELLLKSLTVYGADEISDGLFGLDDEGIKHRSIKHEQDWISSFDRIAVLESKLGESSNYICNLAAKRRYTGSAIKDKLITIEKLKLLQPTGEKILIVEDSLFTGTELCKVFSGLLRTEHPWVKTCKFLIRTAVASDLGYHRFASFLRTQDDLDATLQIDPRNLRPNLTSEGLIAARRMELYSPDGHPEQPQWIKSDLEIIGLNDKNPKLLTLCRNAGEQIMRDWLTRKKCERGWIDARMPLWALGYSGLGTLAILPNCAPKPMLAVLRFGGQVEFRAKPRGKTFRGYWHPLIPETDVRDDMALGN